MRFPVWVLLAGLMAGCCIAQDTTQPEDSPAKRCYPYAMPIHAWDTVMKGMPYRGERVLRCEETLADGTVIKGKESFLEWRDSLGRFRSQALDPLFGSTDVYEVQVIDPVDHVRWQWDLGKGSSHQTVETRYKFRHEYAQWQMDHQFGQMVGPSPDFKQVLLDPIWMNGVYATGARDFQLCQPRQYGNKTDRPAMIMVNETWISVDLGEAVKVRITDSSGGKEMDDLYVLDRREPDATLFEPPAGNEVLETKPVGDAVDESTGEEPSQQAEQPSVKAPGKPALVILSPNGSTTVTPAHKAPPEH